MSGFVCVQSKYLPLNEERFYLVFVSATLLSRYKYNKLMC